MAGSDSGIKARLHRARLRHPGLDRLLRTQEHFGEVQAGQQAGAATYFAFLSIFPILALAVFVVGYIAEVYPDAREDLTDAINSVVPGLISENGISLDDVQTFSGLAGLIGLAGVLYAGLGWLSALRTALGIVFEQPDSRRSNFVVGKLRDLVALVVLGTILMVSVAVTGVARGMSTTIMDRLGFEDSAGWSVTVVTVLLGLAANTLLFFSLFHLPAGIHLPARAMWAGAFLGGIAFEILKQASEILLGAVRGQPASQAFGTALILLVWINYTSKATLYAASFAYVAPEARKLRQAEYEPVPVQGPQLPPLELRAGPRPPVGPPGRVSAFLAGAASVVGAAALLRLVEELPGRIARAVTRNRH